MTDIAISNAAEPITAPVAKVSDKRQKGELTQEYVAELRQENKERRVESEKLAKNLEETAKKLQETEENSKKALEEVKSLQVQAEQKMIRADLKVFANKYNLRDIDDIKLADLSGIKVDEKGDVTGVEAAIVALKEKKPYLFAEVSTSRNNYDPQPAAHDLHNPDQVMKMSAQEYKAFEEDFLSGIGR
jgi:hypothetical protein